MTKRWSNVRSDLLKTKRQASKELRAKLKRLADEPPAAIFDSTEELMAYLNESKE